jgi:hypothetical protein
LPSNPDFEDRTFSREVGKFLAGYAALHPFFIKFINFDTIINTLLITSPFTVQELVSSYWLLK